MRAAIHVNRALLVERADAVLDRDELARVWIPVFPDRDVGGPAIDVWRDVHAALLLGQRQPRGIPAFGVSPRSIGERQSGVVAEFRPRNALAEVFLVARRPGAAQVDLRRHPRRQQARREHAYRGNNSRLHSVTPDTASGSISSRRPLA